MSASGFCPIDCAASTDPIRSRRVLPDMPYANAMPYRKTALEKPPSRKYLNPPSALASLSRLRAVRI